MPLQDKIGHLQADTVLVREDIPFPVTIRVSTSVLEAPWCFLEAIRPAQLGRQLFALFAKHFWENRTGALAGFLRSTRRSSQGFRLGPDQCPGASP